MAQQNPQTRPSVHIINHTHWDREWFLTEEYTTAWIPELIDAIDERKASNPGFRYLLDGQTLVIEDLLRSDPRYADAVARLVGAGTIGMGPLYSQPDWRIASGELLLRNLRTGITDAARLGGLTTTAWLVDTFGHISQAPQLLALCGVQSAYVWRGVPLLAPLFRWTSPDGSEVAAINLFGGYRNLYGISRTRPLALRRLRGEYDKLSGYYGELAMPLFDGYDLETEPEDPIAVLRDLGDELGDGDTLAFDLVESSPESYAQAVRGHARTAPAIDGELLSGKYGSTFPGTLSTRTYLKVMHADAEHLLHAVCEPLATLAAACGTPYPSELYQAWDRELLRNAVHDCICGVSVDPVHERMERSYRRLLASMASDAHRSMQSVARCMAEGSYVLSTTPVPRAGSVRAGAHVYRFDARGLGLSPATAMAVRAEMAQIPVADAEGPSSRLALDNGAISFDGVVIGPIEVRCDTGDCYSSEPGELLDTCRIESAQVESSSDLDQVVSLVAAAHWNGGELTATVRLRTSGSPTAELDIEIDSCGTGFIAELIVDPGRIGTLHAGMPFDIVERPATDTDLFGHDIDPGLARVLMGQREVGEVSTFPFHDFVASCDDGHSVIVHARGVRAYRAGHDGTIAVPLRRSVEWLAKTGLRTRSGDAGPSMYVPGARCERKVRHQVGISVVDAAPAAAEFVAVCEAFRNPPIVVEIMHSEGTADRWEPVQAHLPLTALCHDGEEPLARYYNPADSPTFLHGQQIGGGEIAELPATINASAAGRAIPSIQMHQLGADRGGRSRSMPDPGIVQTLLRRAEQLWAEASEIRESLEKLDGDSCHLAVHQALIRERESLELKLSAAFNQCRLDRPDADVCLPDVALPAVAELGRSLNERRIERRIYDYVAELINHQADV